MKPCFRYRIYVDGKCIEEVEDITRYWRDDLVTFIIGCSFSFEEAMMRAGLPVRHVEMNTNVPMYNTNQACSSAGIFRYQYDYRMYSFPL